MDRSLWFLEGLGWRVRILRRSNGSQGRVDVLVDVERRRLMVVGWWDPGRDWGGRNSLLIVDVEVLDFGGRNDQGVTILLALDPDLPEGDVLARDNLFDFASQTDTVLEADVHGRARPLGTFGRHGDGDRAMRIQLRAWSGRLVGEIGRGAVEYTVCVVCAWQRRWDDKGQACEERRRWLVCGPSSNLGR